MRDRGQLTRLFNFRAREVFPAAGLILADGPAVLSRPDIGAEGPFFSDEQRVYEPAFLFSLRPDAEDIAIELLADLMPSGSRIGLDGALPLPLAGRVEPVDLRPLLARHRRFKHPDELALIEAAASAGEDAYRKIEPLLVATPREISMDVFPHLRLRENGIPFRQSRGRVGAAMGRSGCDESALEQTVDEDRVPAEEVRPDFGGSCTLERTP